jgi:hypothetical protein
MVILLIGSGVEAITHSRSPAKRETKRRALGLEESLWNVAITPKEEDVAVFTLSDEVASIYRLDGAALILLAWGVEAITPKEEDVAVFTLSDEVASIHRLDGAALILLAWGVEAITQSVEAGRGYQC